MTGGGPPRPVDRGAEVLLRQLELAVMRRLDGMLQGDHQGLLAAAGSEPGEARAYEAGDDVRRMDWNVTARTGVAHVRNPIADRELETWVVVDLSASLDFGTARCEKRDLAVAAVAAVGHLTARSGNRIGAVVTHGDATFRIPARPGRDHLSAMLHRLASTPRADGGGPTDLAGALRLVDRLARRRGVVVVVSDFVGAPGWDRPLRALAVRQDLVAVEVLDPRDLSLPDVGLLTLVDPETGRHLEVQTADRRLRVRFEAAATAQRSEIATTLRVAGADHVVVRTDRDWLVDLVRFVVRRRRRRAALPSGRPALVT